MVVRATRSVPSGSNSITGPASATRGASTFGSGWLFAGAFLAGAGAALVLAGGAAFVAAGLVAGAFDAGGSALAGALVAVAAALELAAAGSVFASTQPLRRTLTHEPCLPLVKIPARGRTSPRITPRMDGAERSRMAILPVRCAGKESRAGPRFDPSIQPVKVT
jgi:hypothetical protein